MDKVIKKIISVLEQSNKSILVVLILGVLTLGIIYSVYLGNNLRYPDEWDYYKIATNVIIEHQFSLDGQSPTAFRAPGYPLTLAFFMRLGANIVHLRIINFIILGSSIYLLNVIIKRESTQLAATICILLVISMPVLFYTAGALYPQTLASFLILLLIFLLNRDIHSNWIFWISGILFGYLILTIPMLIFVLIIFIIWWYWYSQRALKPFKITIVISILLISAWSARNYTIFNSFVFISSNSGLNLLLGNSENTTPNAGVNVDISKYTNFANTAQLDEIELDIYYRAEAIEYILSHKFHSAKSYLLKFLNYFNYRNELWTKSEASSLRDMVMLITYEPLLLLFGSRLFLIRIFRLSKFEILLIGLYLSSAMFHAIFFTRIRFRLPFDFLLIAVVAMFIQNILRYARLYHPPSIEIANK